ncbi:MAG: MCE family protein [Planctomycetes bacterium]|nr:MCE family protein [Planctomycetota bacterium]
MEKLRRDTLLGVVFFGTLAFLLWATVNLTDLSLDKELVVYFPNGGSVEVGTNVMVLGKKVGKVGAIDVEYDRTDNPVRLSLLLAEDVPLREGHLIEVRDAGVLGGKQVYIDPGRGAAVASGTVLLGLVAGSAFDKLGGIADGQGAVGERLSETLVAIRDFFRAMNDKDTSVGALLNDRKLYDGLLDATNSLTSILRAIEAGDGAVGQLIMNRRTGEDIASLMENLRRVSDQLLTTDGPLGVLLNDKATANDLQTISHNLSLLLADAKAGKGVAGRLFQDEELGHRFGEMVADLATLMRKANDPDAGALGAITSDPTMAGDLKIAIANVKDVTEYLTRKDTLWGAIANDPDVGARFRRIMTQVSRAIEDAREAAPIGNFVQVLLGAF